MFISRLYTIVVSLFTISLGGCVFSSPEVITLSGGSAGSAYQRISEQIKHSAATVVNMEVVDKHHSQGSVENLKRLLEGEVDFAIVQLDVASAAMKEGKVKTLLILSQEYIHIITRNDSEIKTFSDLAGKRVLMGAPQSGIYFTAQKLFEASNLQVEEVKSNEAWLPKLVNQEVDAIVYVGPLGTSEQMRQQLRQAPPLRFIPLPPSLINYLTIQFPESYQSAIIAQGTYKPLPQLPAEDLATLSIPGALVTRSDVERNKVALLTWAIVSTVRQYSQFYPALAAEDGQFLLYKGLIYLHSGAQQVFRGGDPRGAWLRYIQGNKPLQAASIMLLTTSSIGFFLRWWRRRHSERFLKGNRRAILELRKVLEHNPQKALEEVEEIRQQHRLMLIEGTISTEVYEQVARMTQIFADQCRAKLEKSNASFVP